MWEIEYSQEVKFYFLDNYPYTFDLLVRIEELKYFLDAVPPQGCTQLEPDFYLWVVLDHLVFYEKTGTRIYIWVVKPVE